jgi:hypothetical protein
LKKEAATCKGGGDRRRPSNSIGKLVFTVVVVYPSIHRYMQGGADQGGGMEMSFAGGAECSSSSATAAAAAAAAAASEAEERQLLKGEIAVHPLCEQLVTAHVGCLRVATPIDHLPLIDAQLAQSSGLLHSYAAHHRPFLSPHDKHDLDSFLVRVSIIILLL